jgi:hypothetical protein
MAAVKYSDEHCRTFDHSMKNSKVQDQEFSNPILNVRQGKKFRKSKILPSNTSNQSLHLLLLIKAYLIWIKGWGITIEGNQTQKY